MLRWRLYRDNYRFMNLELLKNRSYYLLFLAATLFLTLSFKVDKNQTLDINVHDTYYIILQQDAFILLFLTFIITGLFYLIFDYCKIQLISFLSFSHTYGSLIFIVLFFYYLDKINSTSIFNSFDYNFRIIITLLNFVFLQFIFVINLITSIIKKLSNLAPQ
jgi:hypothetical protein